MKLTLLDIVPRIKRMLKDPHLINTNIWFSVAAGLIEGVALCLLLPGITALAHNEPVWGLGIWGWVTVLSILAAISAVVGYLQSLRGYQAALNFLVNVHKKSWRPGVVASARLVQPPPRWAAFPPSVQRTRHDR